MGLKVLVNDYSLEVYSLNISLLTGEKKPID